MTHDEEEVIRKRQRERSRVLMFAITIAKMTINQ